MFHILCIEDSPDIEHILSASLKDYKLTFAATSFEAKKQLIKNDFSLILLDIGLPDGDGFEIYSLFENKLENTPVIFLTAKRDLETKSNAFLLGAEDFIEKPFDPQEVKLRVQAKLKKAKRSEEKNKTFKLGSIECDLQEQKLQYNEKSIDLTFIEMKIFHFLALNPNTTFSRSEILKKIWGLNVNINNRSVDVHISNLRKKIVSADVLIEGVVGSGYRLLIINR